MPFAAIWMDLEIIKLSKVSQKEKDKYHIYNLSVESKYDPNELIYKTEAVTDPGNRSADTNYYI